MRANILALLVLLGLFAASVVAVDTEMSLQSTLGSEITPELQVELDNVNSAVNEAESSLSDDEHAQQLAEFDEGELALLEMEADIDTETDADDALFLESDSDSDSEADTVMEMDADADSEVVSSVDVDADVEANSEAGAVTVADGEAEHEQDADPIVTEQMEVQQALEQYGFLEADADADAETDADAESEMEADAESEMEAEAGADAAAEAGEEQTAITKCGKKITWERNQEPNPYVQA